MNIVIGGKSTPKQKKSQWQTRFEKLRSELEKERKKNTRFMVEMDELVVLYQKQVQESDRKQINVLKMLAGKLITFAGRKSLSEWHRDELSDWTREMVQRIGTIEAETLSTSGHTRHRHDG